MKKIAIAFEDPSLIAHVGGGELHKIEGHFYGDTADRSLLLFDASAVPADNAVPTLRSLTIFQTNPFSFVFDPPISFKTGLVAVVSSTNEKLTAIAEDADIEADIEATAERDATETTATASAENKLDVWNNAANPSMTKRLISITVVNPSADTWVQVHGKDSPADGDVAFMERKIVTSDTVLFSFGRDGLSFGPGTTGYKGCRIRFSSTPGVLTTQADTADTITATYK